ncbi:MAG: hypothetical protein QG637_249, partial [Chloroflexota bacterium]|nr:hypothetical protein [Chloroflexota bacterium]
ATFPGADGDKPPPCCGLSSVPGTIDTHHGRMINGR